MNRPLTVALMLGIGLAATWATKGAEAQDRFRYADPANNVVVFGTKLKVLGATKPNTTLILVGNVEMNSQTQGLKLTAQHVVADLVTVSDTKREVRRAEGTGGVHITKIVTNKDGRQTTDITGTTAVLDAKQSGSVVTLTGPVTIRNIDSQKRTTLTTTGSGGTATLAPGDRTKISTGLISANLQGPVKVDILQVRPNPKDGDALTEATADHMTIDNSGKSPKIVLTGHVEIHGKQGSSIGSYTHLSRATFELNAAGEVTNIDTEAG